MQSLVLEKPEKIKLKKVDVPQYACNDVLIRVIAAAICHTDFVVMQGQHAWAKFPCVLGHEFSGIVEETGSGVTNLKKGDRVTSTGYTYCQTCFQCRRGISNACKDIRGIPFHMDGAFQEYISMPSNTIFKVNKSISMEEASLIEPAANGYAVADRANIYPGEKVVVIGPGPIGLFALQFAKLKQPETLIMNGTRKERLDLATDLGATHIINVKEDDPYEIIMNITHGYGADVVLFCGGGLDAWKMAESILAPFGRVVVEVIPEKDDIKWPVTVSEFTKKSPAFLGVTGFNSAQFYTTLKLIEAAKIKVAPLITHRFPLVEYEKAFSTSLNRKDGAIKVIFNIGVE